MALDDMLRAIEEEGEEQCQTILKAAEDESKKIIDKAREEEKELKLEHIRKAESSVQGDRSKILKDAKFAVAKQIIRAKESNIEEVFKGAAKGLEAMRSSGEYSKHFRHLFEETVANSDEKLIVSVDKRDKELASQLIAEMGVACELRADITCLGGLKATSPDGRIALTNTFDSRLERAKQYLKTDVTITLFG